ncbi:tRNA pseudouridine synthase B [Friedmanniella luteola]|uniref:tRNA pseudouridine synthase B n=1 Tax=Friedmanniella luteola TaxID=546871 RepID=A0A1H1Q4N3_9ACTN|nr:tRNA pseudouridine(55) synthase TruB [Friedmanniella luteola]SDS18293.1 tRNA pseudouridine synthase B [Friedmanniella luteola]
MSGSGRATTGTAEAGLVVVDKPAGLTSHQVVARCRRLLGTRKVGHAGTLDPMATGVLLIGVNRATRLLGHLMLTRKAYSATLRLGVGTVTDDAEGETTLRPGVTDLDPAALEAALVPLRGLIEQVPTAVSAIKVDGVRSYARVRAGEDVALAARPVTVHRLDVTARRDLVVDGVPCVDLDVVVECSSGTYVRALARDLGTTLGSAGHLTALRRTAVGPFGLDEAVPLTDATESLPVLGLTDVVRRTFATVVLDAEQEAAVRVGRALPGLALPAEQAALLSVEDEFLALYRRRGDGAVADAVFCG